MRMGTRVRLTITKRRKQEACNSHSPARGELPRSSSHFRIPCCALTLLIIKVRTGHLALPLAAEAMWSLTVFLIVSLLAAARTFVASLGTNRGRREIFLVVTPANVRVTNVRASPVFNQWHVSDMWVLRLGKDGRCETGDREWLRRCWWRMNSRRQC